MDRPSLGLEASCTLKPRPLSIEVILSAGIDIGTSTTQLIFSRLTLENRAVSYMAPQIDIVDKEVVYRSTGRCCWCRRPRPGWPPQRGVAWTGRPPRPPVVYRSPIYFTPLKSPTEIDAEAVKDIVRREYAAGGMSPKDIQTGAVIITGEIPVRRDQVEGLGQLVGHQAADLVEHLRVGPVSGGDLDAVAVGQGVADCVYQEVRGDVFQYGDIGVLLGRAIREDPDLSRVERCPALETIRATVVGAGTHATDVRSPPLRIR